MKNYLLLLIATLLISCNGKPPPGPLEDELPQDTVVTPVDTVIIDTVIYDVKANARAGEMYDYVMLFDKFKGRVGLSLALQDFTNARAALMNTLATFRDTVTGELLDTSLIRVHFRNVSQDLGCDDAVGLNEGMVCNGGKVLTVAGKVSAGQFIVDDIFVFANEKGSGGSDGSSITVTGLGNHASSQFCTFIQAAFYGKMWHEYLHTRVCMCHVDSSWNKLAGVFTTNGSCGIWNAPILVAHQQRIINHVKSRVN